ncbi:MAG: V-type ATPase subunit a family protein [Kiritimatiellae bacterium]|nr:V-type ATPase subunit a family protein [Kiritimatiellia bacterium]
MSSMTISTAPSALAATIPLVAISANEVADPAIKNAAKLAQIAAGATNLIDAYAQAQESRAKAQEMLAKAAALEAKAELAEIKEDLEDFIRELEEKIRLLEKLLTKEGDDVQAEVRHEENIAAQVAASIEEMSEKAEKLVAGFEPRREEILNEKRGIEA